LKLTDLQLICDFDLNKKIVIIPNTVKIEWFIASETSARKKIIKNSSTTAFWVISKIRRIALIPQL